MKTVIRIARTLTTPGPMICEIMAQVDQKIMTTGRPTLSPMAL